MFYFPLPVPPFWFAIAITFAILFSSSHAESRLLLLEQTASIMYMKRGHKLKSHVLLFIHFYLVICKNNF